MPADVFVSYRHADAEPVRRLVAAIEAAGVSVWMDEAEIAEFDQITGRIQHGLARSKALLAWYSSRYLDSRPCQWELTAAYLAAQRRGDAPGNRILVVNPEPFNAHIHPMDLRDARSLSMTVSADDAQVAGLAAVIRAHVHSLREPIGGGQVLASPRWYGLGGLGSNRFVGRFTLLWQVHSSLWRREHAMVAGGDCGSAVQLTGLGGVGKSLVAEEYARRFGAAYPGGVFWVRAYGNDARRAKVSLDERLVSLDEQIQAFAIDIGLPASDKSPAEIRSALARHLDQAQAPFLWIVDDVEPSEDVDYLARWLAPGRSGKTLMTTRSRDADAFGEVIPVDVLPREDAVALLTTRRRPRDPAEQAAAIRIAEDLGDHPLALDVAGAAIAYYSSFAEFDAGLADPGEDALELARTYGGLLPNGHEKSIATTLLASTLRLGVEGREFLIVASLLAVAPITLELTALVMGNGDEAIGKVRARAAFDQVDRLSLAESAGSDRPARIVHTLVSRVIRRVLDGAGVPRPRRLRLRILAALQQIVEERFADPRHHASIANEVAHMRALLVRVQPPVEDETDEEPDGRGLLLRWLARHDHERGAWRQAETLYRQEWALWVERRGPDAPHALAAMNGVALALKDQGDLASARPLLEELLERGRRVYGADAPNTLTVMNNLAQTLQEQGHQSDAHVLFEETLALRTRVLGAEHPDRLISLSDVAGSFKSLGDYEKARALNLEVLTVRRRLFGNEHPGTITSMNNLASVFWAEGNAAAARPLFDETLALTTRLFGPDHPKTVLASLNLAAAMRSAGDLSRARALAEAGLAQARRLFGARHPTTLLALVNLATTLKEQGALAPAHALLQEAHGVATHLYGTQHPKTVQVADWLAHTHHALAARPPGDLQ